MYLLFFVIFICYGSCSNSFELSPDNVFTHGESSFRVLLVHKKTSSIYVASKDNLFRLWLYNINDTSSSLYSHRSFITTPDELQECRQIGHSANECATWIRTIFSKDDGQNLVVCMSQAMKPQLGLIDSYRLKDVEEFRTIIGICSQHENLNTTAVYVEGGNPSDIPSFYSGIQTGLSLENHLIYRPPLIQNGKEVHQALRTPIYDSNWLNDPQFVGSFDVGQYVYFFFREVVQGIQNQGLSVISRVGRICKSDLGGRSVLKQVWTSFLKARLNCSTFSEFSYYFDHIQSVVKVESEQDTFFYATFADALYKSAICVFSYNDINKIFDTGLFVEQTASGIISSLTLPEKVPSHRPGTCLRDSRALDDEALNFVKNHLLMSDMVHGTMVYKTNKLLTKVAVDVINELTTVIFAYSPPEKVFLKIVNWGLQSHPPNSGQNQDNSRLLASYKIQFAEKIHNFAILKNEYLYVLQDTQVLQFRLSQCYFYKVCSQCAMDPYCSWNIARNECYVNEPIYETASGWITSSKNVGFKSTLEKCTNYMHTHSHELVPGDSLLLQCPSSNSEDSTSTEWFFDSRPISFDNTQHIVHTSSGDIVILNSTVDHGGTYRCLINKSPVIEYTLRVDSDGCSHPRTMKQFQTAQRDWCRKVEDYQSNLSKWKSIYQSNARANERDSETAFNNS